MKGVKGLSWFVAAFLFAIVHAAAQTPPPAASPQIPAAMSEQQMDAMADAISQRVMKKLSDAGMQPAATSPSTPASDPADAMDNSEQARFIMRSAGLVTDLPKVLAAIQSLGDHLDAAENDGRPLASYLFMLALAVALALLAEWLVRWLLTPLRRRIAADMRGLSGLRGLFFLLLLEVPPLLALWIASNAIEAAHFMGEIPQVKFTVFVLKILWTWRVSLVALRFTLQPSLPPARLPDLSDKDARAIYRGTAAALLLVFVGSAFITLLRALKSPAEVVSSAQFYMAVIIAALMITLYGGLKSEMGRWFAGITNPDRPSALKRFLARYWFVGAVPLFLAFAGADIYGAVMGETRVTNAILFTLGVLITLLLLESLVHRMRDLLQHRSENGVHLIHPRGAEALARSARFGILLLATAAVARSWTVDVSGLMAGDTFNALANRLMAVSITIFAAYCAWELVRFFTDRYTASHRAVALPPGSADAEDDETLVAASRVATMMPLLRIALAVAICVLATLTALSQLGVNVTPLIAGASIFGLAISFGSQTLVKDVVSGLFFLIDDAFRVGEYIDCGKAKGTVEGFTLRSLKLRHQNGPVHTIPYGQLGQVTNYSRDWSTLKFTLRFVHGTDLEKLRRATKKIGQEMLEDPEMKEEFLTPLKMQGVFDITDSAVIVRFKFTVKPNKPTFIQREALKRLVRTLPELGIQFATGAVSVRSLDGRAMPELLGAAAASANNTAAAAAAATAGQ